MPPPSAADAKALTGAAPDAAVESLPGGYVVVAPERHAAPYPVEERRYGLRFSRVVAVYEPEGGSGRLVRRVTLHHEPDQRTQAVTTARLVARLLRLHRERFGRDAAFPRAAPAAAVYLSPDTPKAAALLGGETRGHEVYVFGAGTPRTPLEWTRTVVHEWGHATLPAARGYSEPESDASGYLGERLYFKWLYEEAVSAETTDYQDGTSLPDLELYHRRQIAPLIARFDAAGPNAPAWGRTDTTGMDLYIGAALAFDQAFGSRLLGRALYAIQDVTPRDLLRAMSDVVARAASGSLPVRLPAWVPLAQSRYRVAAADAASGSIAVSDLATVRLDKKGTTLRVARSGWRRVTPKQGSVTRIYLRRDTPAGEAAAEEGAAK